MRYFTNRQAIQTKFLAPTNSRGSRVKAFAAAGSLVMGWDHRLNPEQNHKAAAEIFANRMDWRGKWFAGTLPSGDMVFVNAEGASARDSFEDHAFEVHDISDVAKLSDNELLAELNS